MTTALETDPVFKVVEEPTGFTEQEAYELLAGVELTPLVAAAQTAHTGAMIALVPSDADVARLVAEYGEAAENLHLTLLYLGDADAISEEQRSDIIDAALGYFLNPVTTEGFSISIFNPHTAAVQTALVMGVRGEDMMESRDNVRRSVKAAYAGLPQQHEPWIPHVTLAYSEDLERAAQLCDKLGPITFDKMRIAFGGAAVDFWLEENEVMAAAVSRLPPQLRKYWLGPEGSARVGGWGSPGSFRACQREMKQEDVPRRFIDGLCANLYRWATGRNPGRKKNNMALTAAFDPNTGQELPSFLPWEGVLTVEGVESGDGRMFELGSLDWARTPLPLMYQSSTAGGHGGSVLVGQISHIARRGNELYGWGVLDLASPLGAEVYRLMSEELLNGVSVDVDKVSEADVTMMYPDGFDKPARTVFDRGRIRGATLVAFPAFTEAAIYLTGEEMTASAVGELCSMEPYTASVRTKGWSALPIAGSDRTWDKGEAVARLKEWAGEDISDKYAHAFLWRDDEDDPDLQGSYKFPIADVIDGDLTIVPNAVRNAASRLDSADISSADKDKMRAVISGLLEDITTAAVHTITLTDLPPASWFDEPTDVALKGALTITDEGRIYGLLAPGGVTHRSMPKQVPNGNVDYTRFLKGETIVEGGARVVTGPITFNCGHAPTQNYGTYEKRRMHYDNSCSVFADIAIGTRPDRSVWVAGAVKPYATADQIQAAMSCSLSGDWQPHPDRPGVREFIAALLVPVPGFAMARSSASVTFEEGALVAAVVPVVLQERTPESEAIVVASTVREQVILKQALVRKSELAGKVVR